MKRFIFTQLIILIVGGLAGILTKKLIPNHHLVCKNVEEIQVNSLLSTVGTYSMQDMYQDGNQHIEDMKAEAEEGHYDFTVAELEVEQYRLISYDNILISCNIGSVYEGNEALSGKQIQAYVRYVELTYPYEKDKKEFFDYVAQDPSAHESSVMDAAKNIPCFYYSYKNVPLSHHKYLAFIKHRKLSDSSQEYFFLMDCFDLSNTESKPVVEGCLGQYQDYKENEVFFQSQEDIDLYYSLKESILSTYLKN